METKDERQEMSGPRYWVTFIFAAGLVLAFVASCWVMVGLADNAGVDEKVWGRYVFLFGGFEAIVFTAVGWLFGREVHRSAVEVARKDAADAKNDSVEAKQEAARGRALAAAVKASTSSRPGPRSAVAGPAESAEMATIRRIAEEMFPSDQPPQAASGAGG